MKQFIIILVICFSLYSFLFSACSRGKETEPWQAEELRITIADAKELLGHENTVFIDVRSIADWKNSTTKIKGAQRKLYKEFDAWINTYRPAQKLVLYCS